MRAAQCSSRTRRMSTSCCRKSTALSAHTWSGGVRWWCPRRPRPPRIRACSTARRRRAGGRAASFRALHPGRVAPALRGQVGVGAPGCLRWRGCLFHHRQQQPFRPARRVPRAGPGAISRAPGTRGTLTPWTTRVPNSCPAPSLTAVARPRGLPRSSTTRCKFSKSTLYVEFYIVNVLGH